ncbi:odorant receptor 22c-like, partial [Glossina fuscipes]|uniref:Odorant receptor 22c-like n=1 Tax=Glossina fuscipes TaxID=7396 RepID=A0A8U0WB51_9MUSC
KKFVVNYLFYPLTYCLLTASVATTVLVFNFVDGFFTCACIYLCVIFQMIRVRVADTLYDDIEWYKCDVKTRKMILMMLRCSQKAATIVVSCFIPSLAAFSSKSAADGHRIRSDVYDDDDALLHELLQLERELLDVASTLTRHGVS